jgi:hypothetical protein
MTRLLKNKKGLASIFLAIYLIILLSVIIGVLYTAVIAATAIARQQINSFQNYYYIERAIKYAAVHYANNLPGPTDDNKLSYPPTDTSRTVITATGTSSIFTIQATRRNKTVSATFDASKGIYTRWGPPS